MNVTHPKSAVDTSILTYINSIFANNIYVY